MTNLAKVVFMLAILINALPTEARSQAQAICFQHDKLEAALAKKFDEHSLGMGTSNQTAMFEIFTSGAGTWTLTITGTNHISCIAGAGEGWESAKPKGDPT